MPSVACGFLNDDGSKCAGAVIGMALTKHGRVPVCSMHRGDYTVEALGRLLARRVREV